MTLPIANSTVLCQITAPISSGSFASIRSLLPAGAITSIGAMKIVSLKVKGIATAIDVRTSAALEGEQIGIGEAVEYPSTSADTLLVRSSGAAAACTISIFLM
jgi:hypothetical protein